MGRLRSTLKRVRLVYRRSSTLTKTVVIATIAISMVVLLFLHGHITAAEKRYEAEKNQAAHLEQDNNKLEENINSIGSVDNAEQIAKDELGMLPSDSVIMIPAE